MSAPVDETGRPSPRPIAPRRTGGAAAIVSAGIMVSRLFGIVRQSLMATYLGATGVADAFQAAFKITNTIQNLFGEGALSTSFIPVYSRLIEKGDDEEARRVASAVGAVLCVVVSVLVLVCILATPLLIPLIAKGFEPARRQLTITYTRILFPGAGIFVISAWCLGIQNSHRKFLLPYLAPVLWNVAMIVTLLWAGPRQGPSDLAVTLAWASVLGAALQFGIQVPSTLRLVNGFRLTLGLGSPNVRTVMRNFGPAFVARGVVQFSSYIDNWLASYLPLGMVATFGYASAIIYLPVSLFGMAIAAAELPEMSRAIGDETEIATYLRGSLARGLRRIAYFVIPSAAAFLAFGDLLARLLFQHGKFSATDSRYAWGILAGASVGLLATTMGRLYSSTYYALHDTKTPLRFAIVRVILTTVLGYLFALTLPRLLGIDPHWGAAGLTASAGIAGWIEFALLRSRLNRRIGVTGVPARFVASLWGSAGLAVAAGWGMRMLAAGESRFVGPVLVIGTYGVVYLGMTVALGIPEARTVVDRIRRRN
ncbi:MAG: murein biosynthesis integral membrane protein MurJ [bacterium]